MITLEVIPPPNLGRIMKQLLHTPEGLRRAVRNTVRRTLRGGRQDAARRVAERYTIPVGNVTKTIKVKVGETSGEMVSKGSRNPLDKFRHNPRVRINPGLPGGIFAQVVKGQGGNLRRAFIQNSGGIWERVSKARFPIHKFYAPSAPGMLAVQPVSKYIVEKMSKRMEINLIHEVNAVLGGF